MQSLHEVCQKWRKGFVHAVLDRVNPEIEATPVLESNDFEYEFATGVSREGIPVEIRFEFRGDEQRLELTTLIKFPDEGERGIRYKSELSDVPNRTYIGQVGMKDPTPVIKQVADALNFVLGFPSKLTEKQVNLTEKWAGRQA
jgi:hypothetical protein